MATENKYSPATAGEGRLAMTAITPAEYLEVRNLLDIVKRLEALAPRLRLRSPATQMEIKVWAELRAQACAAITQAEKGEA